MTLWNRIVAQMIEPLAKLQHLHWRRKMRTRAEALQGRAEELDQAERHHKLVEARRDRELPRLEKMLEDVNESLEELQMVEGELAAEVGAMETSEREESRALQKESRTNLDRIRDQAETELKQFTEESIESSRQLARARQAYLQARENLNTILGDYDKRAEYAPDRGSLDKARLLQIRGTLTELEGEVHSEIGPLAGADQGVQFAQLKYWLGRLRRLQAELHEQVSESTEATNTSWSDLETQANRLFRELADFSKVHQPGHIPAFQRDHKQDWDQMVRQAESELEAFRAEQRRAEQRERERREREERKEAESQANLEAGQLALMDLKAFLMERDDENDPETDASTRTELLDLARRAIPLLGTKDPEFLELIRPYQGLLKGNDFRNLRSHLKRTEPIDPPSLPPQYADLLEWTRGRRAVLIGGDPREDARERLEHAFAFDELTWVEHGTGLPSSLETIEQRVRSGTCQVVLQNKFAGHGVSNRLKPACKAQGGLYARSVGYGVIQVALALRQAVGDPSKPLDVPEGPRNGRPT